MDLFGDTSGESAARLVAAVLRILGRDPGTTAPVGESARIRRITVEVSIADSDGRDTSLSQAVRSVVYVKASEPIGDLTASYVTDHSHGGTASLGHGPFHISTSTWRIRSEFLLRSVADVIIGYTTVMDGRKTQWFQWDGHDHVYNWHEPGADGSLLSALLQIKKITLNGQGPDQQAKLAPRT